MNNDDLILDGREDSSDNYRPHLRLNLDFLKDDDGNFLFGAYPRDGVNPTNRTPVAPIIGKTYTTGEGNPWIYLAGIDNIQPAEDDAIKNGYQELYFKYNYELFSSTDHIERTLEIRIPPYIVGDEVSLNTEIVIIHHSGKTKTLKASFSGGFAQSKIYGATFRVDFVDSVSGMVDERKTAKNLWSALLLTIKDDPEWGRLFRLRKLREGDGNIVEFTGWNQDDQTKDPTRIDYRIIGDSGLIDPQYYSVPTWKSVSGTDDWKYDWINSSKHPNRMILRYESHYPTATEKRAATRYPSYSTVIAIDPKKRIAQVGERGFQPAVWEFRDHLRVTWFWARGCLDIANSRSGDIPHVNRSPLDSENSVYDYLTQSKPSYNFIVNGFASSANDSNSFSASGARDNHKIVLPKIDSTSILSKGNYFNYWNSYPKEQTIKIEGISSKYNRNETIRALEEQIGDCILHGEYNRLNMHSGYSNLSEYKDYPHIVQNAQPMTTDDAAVLSYGLYYPLHEIPGVDYDSDDWESHKYSFQPAKGEMLYDVAPDFDYLDPSSGPLMDNNDQYIPKKIPIPILKNGMPIWRKINEEYKYYIDLYMGNDYKWTLEMYTYGNVPGVAYKYLNCEPPIGVQNVQSVEGPLLVSHDVFWDDVPSSGDRSTFRTNSETGFIDGITQEAVDYFKEVAFWNQSENPYLLKWVKFSSSQGNNIRSPYSVSDIVVKMHCVETDGTTLDLDSTDFAEVQDIISDLNSLIGDAINISLVNESTTDICSESYHSPYYEHSCQRDRGAGEGNNPNIHIFMTTQSRANQIFDKEDNYYENSNIFAARTFNSISERIFRAKMWIVKDATTTYRKHKLREYLTEVLGIAHPGINETHSDSIWYTPSLNLSFSTLDEQVMSLFYNERVKPGMVPDIFESAIRDGFQNIPGPVGMKKRIVCEVDLETDEFECTDSPKPAIHNDDWIPAKESTELTVYKDRASQFFDILGIPNPGLVEGGTGGTLGGRVDVRYSIFFNTYPTNSFFEPGTDREYLIATTGYIRALVFDDNPFTETGDVIFESAPDLGVSNQQPLKKISLALKESMNNRPELIAAEIRKAYSDYIFDFESNCTECGYTTSDTGCSGRTDGKIHAIKCYDDGNLVQYKCCTHSSIDYVSASELWQSTPQIENIHGAAQIVDNSQKTDGNDNLLYLDYNGQETTSETTDPIPIYLDPNDNLTGHAVDPVSGQDNSPYFKPTPIKWSLQYDRTRKTYLTGNEMRAPIYKDIFTRRETVERVNKTGILSKYDAEWVRLGRTSPYLKDLEELQPNTPLYKETPLLTYRELSDDMTEPSYEPSYDQGVKNKLITPSLGAPVAVKGSSDGNYLYVADDLCNLRILNVSDPANPTFEAYAESQNMVLRNEWVTEQSGADSTDYMDDSFVVVCTQGLIKIIKWEDEDELRNVKNFIGQLPGTETTWASTTSWTSPSAAMYWQDAGTQDEQPDDAIDGTNGEAFEHLKRIAGGSESQPQDKFFKWENNQTINFKIHRLDGEGNSIALEQEYYDSIVTMLAEFQAAMNSQADAAHRPNITFNLLNTGGDVNDCSSHNHHDPMEPYKNSATTGGDATGVWPENRSDNCFWCSPGKTFGEAENIVPDINILVTQAFPDAGDTSNDHALNPVLSTIFGTGGASAGNWIRTHETTTSTIPQKRHSRFKESVGDTSGFTMECHPRTFAAAYTKVFGGDDQYQRTADDIHATIAEEIFQTLGFGRDTGYYGTPEWYGGWSIANEGAYPSLLNEHYRRMFGADRNEEAYGTKWQSTRATSTKRDGRIFGWLAGIDKAAMIMLYDNRVKGGMNFHQAEEALSGEKYIPDSRKALLRGMSAFPLDEKVSSSQLFVQNTNSGGDYASSRKVYYFIAAGDGNTGAHLYKINAPSADLPGNSPSWEVSTEDWNDSDYNQLIGYNGQDGSRIQYVGCTRLLTNPNLPETFQSPKSIKVGKTHRTLGASDTNEYPPIYAVHDTNIFAAYRIKGFEKDATAEQYAPVFQMDVGTQASKTNPENMLCKDIELSIDEQTAYILSTYPNDGSSIIQSPIITQITSVDLTDPINPSFLFNLDFTSIDDAATFFGIKKIKRSSDGTKLYCLGYDVEAPSTIACFMILDITDSSSITETSRISFDANLHSEYLDFQISNDGNYAYCYGPYSLETLNISDTSAIVHEHSLKREEMPALSSPNDPRSISISRDGKILYLTGKNFYETVDIAGEKTFALPNSPAFITEWVMPSNLGIADQMNFANYQQRREYNVAGGDCFGARTSSNFPVYNGTELADQYHNNGCISGSVDVCGTNDINGEIDNSCRGLQWHPNDIGSEWWRHQHREGSGWQGTHGRDLQRTKKIIIDSSGNNVFLAGNHPIYGIKYNVLDKQSPYPARVFSTPFGFLPLVKSDYEGLNADRRQLKPYMEKYSSIYDMDYYEPTNSLYFGSDWGLTRIQDSVATETSFTNSGEHGYGLRISGIGFFDTKLVSTQIVDLNEQALTIHKYMNVGTQGATNLETGEINDFAWLGWYSFYGTDSVLNELADVNPYSVGEIKGRVTAVKVSHDGNDVFYGVDVRKAYSAQHPGICYYRAFSRQWMDSHHGVDIFQEYIHKRYYYKDGQTFAARESLPYYGGGVRGVFSMKNSFFDDCEGYSYAMHDGNRNTFGTKEALPHTSIRTLMDGDVVRDIVLDVDNPSLLYVLTDRITPDGRGHLENDSINPPKQEEDFRTLAECRTPVNDYDLEPDSGSSSLLDITYSSTHPNAPDPHPLQNAPEEIQNYFRRTEIAIANGFVSTDTVSGEPSNEYGGKNETSYAGRILVFNVENGYLEGDGWDHISDSRSPDPNSSNSADGINLAPWPANNWVDYSLEDATNFNVNYPKQAQHLDTVYLQVRQLKIDEPTDGGYLLTFPNADSHNTPTDGYYYREFRYGPYFPVNKSGWLDKIHGGLADEVPSLRMISENNQPAEPLTNTEANRQTSWVRWSRTLSPKTLERRFVKIIQAPEDFDRGITETVNKNTKLFIINGTDTLIHNQTRWDSSVRNQIPTGTNQYHVIANYDTFDYDVDIISKPLNVQHIDTLNTIPIFNNNPAFTQYGQTHSYPFTNLEYSDVSDVVIQKEETDSGTRALLFTDNTTGQETTEKYDSSGLENFPIMILAPNTPAKEVVQSKIKITRIPRRYESADLYDNDLNPQSFRNQTIGTAGFGGVPPVPTFLRTLSPGIQLSDYLLELNSEGSKVIEETSGGGLQKRIPFVSTPQFKITAISYDVDTEETPDDPLSELFFLIDPSNEESWTTSTTNYYGRPISALAGGLEQGFTASEWINRLISRGGQVISCCDYPAGADEADILIREEDIIDTSFNFLPKYVNSDGVFTTEPFEDDGVTPTTQVFDQATSPTGLPLYYIMQWDSELNQPAPTQNQTADTKTEVHVSDGVGLTYYVQKLKSDSENNYQHQLVYTEVIGVESDGETLITQETTNRYNTTIVEGGGGNQDALLHEVLGDYIGAENEPVKDDPSSTVNTTTNSVQKRNSSNQLVYVNVNNVETTSDTDSTNKVQATNDSGELLYLLANGTTETTEDTRSEQRTDECDDLLYLAGGNITTNADAAGAAPWYRIISNAKKMIDGTNAAVNLTFDNIPNIQEVDNEIVFSDIRATMEEVDENGHKVVSVSVAEITEPLRDGLATRGLGTLNIPTTASSTDSGSSGISASPVFIFGGSTYLVTSVSAAVGWGGDATSVTLNLVPACGGSIESAGYDPIGTPRRFQYGSFGFTGIVQNWEKSTAAGGDSMTVRLVSPGAVLKSATCILQGVSDETSQSGGLGSNFIAVEPSKSWCKDYGPDWSTVRSAIDGSTIKYMGYNYTVNCGSVGSSVSGLKFDGDAITAMAAIERAASASGQRIYVYLTSVGNVINISTTNMSGLGGTGVISANKPSSCSVQTVSMSHGQEAADAVTSALVNGDFVRAIEEIDGKDKIIPYIGKDPGSPEGDPIRLETEGGDADEWYFTATTGHSEVVSKVAGGSYKIKLIELRAALESFESWLAYVKENKESVLDKAGHPDKDQRWNVEACKQFLNGQKGTPDKELLAKLVNTKKDKAKGSQLTDETKKSKALLQALHDFVRSFGSSLGSKYLVEIPEPETGCSSSEIFHYEKSDGGWAPEGALGLPPEGMPSFFKTDDGKISCFLRFGEADKPSHDTIDGEVKYDGAGMGDDIYVKDKDVYIKGSVEEFIEDSNSSTGYSAVISCSQVLKYKLDEPKLNDDFNNALFVHLSNTEGSAPSSERLGKLLNAPGMSFARGLGLSPPVHCRPDGAVIPYKSNILAYGPWGNDVGGGGRAEYARDTSLNPWTYGSEGALSTVAGFMLLAKIHGTTFIESGSYRHTGAPKFDLGSGLVSGGPNVTNISVQIGTGGVSTTIQMRTFVPNDGEIAQDMLDNFKRMADNNQKMQRAFDNRATERMTFNTKRAMTGVALSDLEGASANAAKADTDEKHNNGEEGGNVQQQNTVAEGGSSSDGQSGTVNTEGGPEKVIKTVPVDDATGWKNRGGGGKDILFRPFGLKKNSGDTPGRLLPEMNLEDMAMKTGEGKVEINAKTLNPWMSIAAAENISDGSTKGHDMYEVNFGKEFTELACSDCGPDEGPVHNVRPLALRGPVIISGWGFDTDAKPVPRKNDDDDEFIKNFLRRPQEWKTGPLDTRWNEERGVWEATGGGGGKVFRFGQAIFKDDSNNGARFLAIKIDEDSYGGGTWQQIGTPDEEDGGVTVIVCDSMDLTGRATSGNQQTSGFSGTAAELEGTLDDDGNPVYVIVQLTRAASGQPGDQTRFLPIDYYTILNYCEGAQCGAGDISEYSLKPQVLGHKGDGVLAWFNIDECACTTECDNCVPYAEDCPEPGVFIADHPGCPDNKGCCEGAEDPPPNS